MPEEQTLSPEEMAAMSREQCIFCHIASGKVAAKKVYEDDKVACVLDINPGNPGHVLIVPKEHYVIMPQIPEDVLQHIGMVAKGISHAQLRALKAQGTNIFVANGVTAGQRAQHFMMHVIPRMDGDQLAFALPERAMSEADMKKAQVVLKKALAKALGLKVPDEKEDKAESQSLKKEEKKTAPKEEPKKEAPKQAREEPAEEEEPEDEEPEEVPGEKPKKQAAKPAKKGTNLDEIARLLTGGR